MFVGERFVKTWTFRNGGEFEWPEDTLFIQTNGDDFKASPKSINRVVKPGEEIDVSVEMEAPKIAGNYISFFRFVHGDNNRFGQKVWCDILVKAAPVQQSPMVFPPEMSKVESIPLNKSVEQIQEPAAQQQIELEFIDVVPEQKQ